MPTGPNGNRMSGAQYRKLRRERGLSEGSKGDPERRRASRRAYSKKNAETMRDRIRRLKVELGCADCGYNAHFYGLEFDHLPIYRKVQGVAELVGQNGRVRLWAELEKCDVVCSTCHKVRTWKRKHPDEPADANGLDAD